MIQSQSPPTPDEANSTVPIAPTMPTSPVQPAVKRLLRIYSHSSLLFWWPVWAVGYGMALLTYWHGRPQRVDDLAQAVEWIHPSSNLGVIFFLTLFLVILVTNFTMRGLASGIVIIGGALVSSRLGQ